MTRNRLIVVIVLVLAVAGAASLPHGPRRADARCRLAARLLPPVAESTTVTSDARAVPIHHVELSAPGAGGVVAEVMVAEGDAVTAGQPCSGSTTPRRSWRSTRRRQRQTSPRPATPRPRTRLDQARRPGRRRARRRRPGARPASASPTRTATRRPRGRTCDERPTPRSTGRRPRSAAPGPSLLAVTHGATRREAALGMARRGRGCRATARLAGARAALDDLTLEAPFAGIVASLDATAGQTVGGAGPSSGSRTRRPGGSRRSTSTRRRSGAWRSGPRRR